MRRRLQLLKGLCCGIVGVALLPYASCAQAPGKTLTTYYDSARTQRRTVYQVQLRGPRPDTVAHGFFRRFWRDGSISEIGHFTEGAADSTWTRYYPVSAGQEPAVSRRLPMKAGQPDGAFTVWHPNGRVAQRGTFRQGQLVDSVVTTSKTGRPRLLARFDSSRTSGLRGTFRQWDGRFTSDFLAVMYYWGDGTSSNNTYPRRDSARYWLGQLNTGRLVGAYTEYDPDGEPRVRLSYTPQGQYRLATLYYPAVWLRNEQGRDQQLPLDSVVHSRPMFEWQAVGQHPYLLQHYWSFSSGLTDDIAQVQLFQMVPYKLPNKRGGHTYVGDLVGILDRPLAPAPLPAQLVAAFMRPVPAQPGLVCSGLATQYLLHKRPPLPEVAVAGGSVLRRYPSLRSYQPPLGLQKLSSPGRWRLGEADTTGIMHRPARRRETALPNRNRVVETPFSTRVYSPKGQLVELTLWRFGGRKLERRYYDNGQPESVTRKGWLASYSRGWNEAGKPISNDLNRLLGIRMVRVRRQVTRNGKVKVRTRIQPRFHKPRGNIHFR
ncbi:hypothetical protein GCM10022409_27100 [Hymenobacter glaciei]|uniref:Toxin-antitoxin system YwqK family antitoxin n=1 Tax=Hymenobacter glaciei TaxID=877209 RepID=A0ABP7UBT1_9BACT